MLNTHLKILIAALALFVLTSFEQMYSQSISTIPHDPSLGEKIWPDEEQAMRAISEELQKAVKARYLKTGFAIRDAHPKPHGCVRGSFEVRQSLSADLQRGIFQPGAQYPAWIRFSNSDSDPDRKDATPDGRGMAIKLMNVLPGVPKLLDEKMTQDFIMINHPTFIIDDPVKYQRLVEASGSSNPITKVDALKALGLGGAKIAASILKKKIANPLYSQYWSMVPYQFGSGTDVKVMKYQVRPCKAQSNKPTNKQLADKNYLRTAMKETLNHTDACFEFYVQTRAPSSVSNLSDLGVEESTREWEESKIPPQKVATLTIKQQTFDTEAQNKFCEELSFSPWHAVEEHRPLGGVNRVRRVVYQEISKLRHDLNHLGVLIPEPTGKEIF